MSTNYYQGTPDNKEDLHIGLWTSNMFRFEAHLAEKLTSHAAWVNHLRSNPERQIYDEYGAQHSIEKFLGIVNLGRRPEKVEFLNSPVVTEAKDIKPGMRYRDADGHLFCAYQFS